MTDATTLASRLMAGLRPLAELPVLTGAGVYAFALAPGAALVGIKPGGRGLLYIGMTGQSLDVRNHFLHADSGRSTLRRSLGALLRGELDLEVRPRGSGRSDRDKVNFRFDEDGERRLTAWMGSTLRACQLGVDDGAATVEKNLISQLQPPLNLTGWRNLQKSVVQAARTDCRTLAQQRS